MYVTLPPGNYGCFNCHSREDISLVGHYDESHIVAVMVVCGVCLQAVKDGTLHVYVSPHIEFEETASE